MSARYHNEYFNSEYSLRYEDKGPFPAICDQINRLNLNGDDTNSDPEDDDLRIVEEIESLCMKCGEDVRLCSCYSLPAKNTDRCSHPGYHSTSFDEDPILP